MLNIQEQIKSFNLNKEEDIFIDSSIKIKTEYLELDNKEYPKFISEFWTSKQRQASSIHEISYRACFKPQLPRYFINLLTNIEDVVYDPFSGRGTTIIEAGLLCRNVISNDINPLSKMLSYARFFIPDLKELENRLNKISIKKSDKCDIDLSMFYHPDTLNEIISIKEYLNTKQINNTEDDLDKWIRMVATNRLTGHSSGFFSIYTLPPNQAISPENQIKINKRYNQIPEYRNTKLIILKKTKDLIKNLTIKDIENLRKIGENAQFVSCDARSTKDLIPKNTVQLTVTSPPFLNIVQYADDNWLRCWFNTINLKEIQKKITMSKNINEWTDVMRDVFIDLYRITKKHGWVAFEVGEIQNGKIKLDEFVVPLGLSAGFTCKGILINEQNFTKTSNIWGVNNNKKGTNSNRIVIFTKEN